MPSIINSDDGQISGSAGLKFTSADDGALQIQNSGTTAISVSAAGQSTFSSPVSQPGGFSFRNKIINGNFDFWQRGTSQTTSGYGSADRWRALNVGSTKTASRQAFALGQPDVPNNPRYFIRHVVTSVAGAANYVSMDHRIEDVQTLAGKTSTLTFWGKADSTKNIAVEIGQYFGSGGPPNPSDYVTVDARLISLASVWTKYTITVPIPSMLNKVIGTDNRDDLRVVFWFDAGSDHSARSASLGQQSGTFDIAQVQLEEGSGATPFEIRPMGLESSLCLRYYQESLGMMTLFRTTASGNFGGAYSDVRLIQEMRVTPVLTLYTTTAKTTQGILVNGTTASTAYTIGNSTRIGFGLWNNGALSADGAYGSFYYTADAEL